MLLATREDMLRFEAEAKSMTGMDDAAMIARAGANAAQAAMAWARRLPESLRQRYLVLAGGGKNGADAWIAANTLHQCGCEVILADFKYDHEYSPEVVKAIGRLAAKPPFRIIDMRKPTTLTQVALLLAPGTVMIDGILGTGFRPPMHGDLMPLAVDSIDLPGYHVPTVALDIPSGMDAETGEGDIILHADLTLAMGFLKPGYFLGRGPECCGEIQVVNFGIDPAVLHCENLHHVDGRDWAFGPEEAAILMPPRSALCHKNTLGRALLLAGSAQYPGAPFLAAAGALRSGCGVVTLALPQAARRREGEAALIVRELPGDECFSKTHLPAIAGMMEEADAVLYGPGIGQEAAPELLQMLLKSNIRLVLDADALRILAAHPRLLSPRRKSRPVVLTPHPGEMAALTAAFCPKLDSRASRRTQAMALARATGCVIVLKGARTIVASPEDDEISYNCSGNPALATAGSGDVLAGMIAAFATQMAPPQAAQLGVYLHGLAADLYVRNASPRGMVADDLPGLIPQAIRQCVPW